MKRVLSLGLTWFWTGGALAVANGITMQDGLMANPKQTAGIFVLGGIAGVLNHMRQPPPSAQ